VKKSSKKNFFDEFIINLKNQDKALLFCTIALTIWGLFNIVTASSRESVTHFDQSLYYYFFRHLVMISIGFAISLCIINISSKKHYFLSTLGYVGIIILIIVALISSAIRGANSWLFGGSIQPSEFAKPILIVFLSCAYDKYQKKLRAKDYKERVKYIIRFLILSFIIPLLVFLQRDAGTAIIIFSIVGILYLVNPMTRIDKFKSILLGLGAALFLGLVLLFAQGSILTKEQKSRIKYWLNPCQNYENGGYQVCNGYIAFNQGGLFGLGLGKSQQKYSYIPEPHTDSVFAIIAEELGAIKCGFIFILYGVLLYRICKIGSKATKLRSRYMCVGVATYIFVHIFINLGGLFGIIPVTGIPLPFFTYGGSFTISLLASIAFVQKVHIETKLSKITI